MLIDETYIAIKISLSVLGNQKRVIIVYPRRGPSDHTQL